jgi:hypothetical protein
MIEPLLNLIRVLRAAPQSDDEIRILTLEMYDDGFIVRWVLPKGAQGLPESAAEAGLNPMGFMSLTLRDALATEYQLVGMTGGTHHGFTMYRPAIPQQARWLDVFTKGGAVRFDVWAPE